MSKRRRDVVTCHLCARVWAAPRGYGQEIYRLHYIDEHYVDLEIERRST